MIQAQKQFIDQVRTLAKSKILWNHGIVLLCPSPGDKLYSTFGVDKELLRDALWTEPSFNVRGLKLPESFQPGMLEFDPATVQTSGVAKLCAKTGLSQRFAVLEWGLVNPEKILEFIFRMKIDMKFRSYYFASMIL